jgi:hypothetical protein
LLPSWVRRLLALREKTVFDRSKLLAASGERSWLDLSPEHALALLEKYPRPLSRGMGRADEPGEPIRLRRF